MTGVGLEALSFTVVPELERAETTSGIGQFQGLGQGQGQGLGQGQGQGQGLGQGQGQGLGQGHGECYLSRVAARMYLPLGENFTNETGGLSSSMSVFKHWPEAVSQIRLNKSSKLTTRAKKARTVGWKVPLTRGRRNYWKL